PTARSTARCAQAPPVTVYSDTANAAASAGSLHDALPIYVTVAAGQTSQTFTVAVLGDRVPEPTETFAVNLSGASSNSLITDAQGLGTILDDEPRITIDDVTVTDGNTGSVSATFRVTLSVA